MVASIGGPHDGQARTGGCATVHHWALFLEVSHGSLLDLSIRECVLMFPGKQRDSLPYLMFVHSGWELHILYK